MSDDHQHHLRRTCVQQPPKTLTAFLCNMGTTYRSNVFHNSHVPWSKGRWNPLLHRRSVTHSTITHTVLGCWKHVTITNIHNDGQRHYNEAAWLYRTFEPWQRYKHRMSSIFCWEFVITPLSSSPRDDGRILFPKNVRHNGQIRVETVLSIHWPTNQKQRRTTIHYTTFHTGII